MPCFTFVAQIPTSHFKTRMFLSGAAANSMHGWLSALVFVALWLGGGAVAVRGQSPLDGFDPNADQEVRAVAVQADGKILIGGPFASLSPNGGAAVTRHNIARLNPDGTVDATFNPNASGNVLSIAVQADGKILIGGLFNSLSPNGGAAVARNRIARLNADGTVDAAFNPNANDTVFSIAVGTDGKILIGGRFTSLSPNGGAAVTRNHIARLNADGTLDATFDPNADGFVYSIVVQAYGKVLIGGLFTSLSPNGGAAVTRNRVARLNVDGTLDETFNPNADNAVLSIAVQADKKILLGGGFTSLAPNGGASVTRNRIARLNRDGTLDEAFNPNADNAVTSVAMQADGRILIGGFFTGLSPNGGAAVARNRIARLNADGTLDAALNPNANGDVHSIALQADGKIVIGGDFRALAPNGGATVTRNRIARLQLDGTLDATLNPNPNNYVYAIVQQADGKILIGGGFTTLSPNGGAAITRNHIARLNPDGTVEAAFDPNPNLNSTVYTIALQTDGKILIGGSFTSLSPNGGAAVTRHNIARLHADGTLDATFDPNADNPVVAIAVQADGKILIGGGFTTLAPNGGGPVSRNRIARLNADGTLDPTFNPNANNYVGPITVQADGKILIGGGFTSLSPNGGAAVARSHIARLNTDGTLDETFNPNANDVVDSIAVQADGKILIGGSFTTLAPSGGAPVTRNRIARLNTDGMLDAAFNPNANNGLYSIVVQADGKILIGGYFTGLAPNGGAAVARNSIARLNADGTVDPIFDPNANNLILSIALQADGKILIGGFFTSLSPNGGAAVQRNNFARLSNDTAALQNLTVTKTTITWTRGGSSPELTRVNFEYSNDNVNYFSLGNGARSGSNWSRTGLSLSTGRNFYIRARGYYGSGSPGGSESITESVRNAYVAGPTAGDSTISGSIYTPEGAPFAGAVVQLSGSQTRKTITDAAGNYRFDNVETSGFYTVTPARWGYSFGPANQSFSQLGNATEAAFTAVPNSLIAANAIDTPEYFVRQQYLDFLGREPDEGGFHFWSDQIVSCADSACIERRSINVSAAYFLSIEFQQTGGLVDRLYRASYGRAPRYAEFMPDTRAVAHNLVVGSSGWEQQLYLNKQAFVAAFVQRAEFKAAFDNLSNQNFVSALVSQTGLNSNQAEQAALVSGLNEGTLTRAAALQRVAENEQFVTAKHNEAFVMMQYFGYLRRDPDPAGYQFWLNKLNQFGGNFEQADMVKAFIVSSEYRNRFPR